MEILDLELQYSQVLLSKNINQEQKLHLEQFKYRVLLERHLYLKPILDLVPSVPLVEQLKLTEIILQIKLFQLLSLVQLRILRIPMEMQVLELFLLVEMLELKFVENHYLLDLEQFKYQVLLEKDLLHKQQLDLEL